MKNSAVLVEIIGLRHESNENVAMLARWQLLSMQYSVRIFIAAKLYNYRAMHVVLARYCYRKSSVRLSVTLVYRGYIGWTSSKLITRIISLGSSLLGRTTSAI